MRRCKQVIRLMAILQAEDVVAVLLPTVGRLVRLARQQGREVHFLRANAVDLLANDVFDLVENGEAERQPRPYARGGLANITGSLEQLCGIDVCVCGVFTQRAQEQCGHSKSFGHTLQIMRIPRHRRCMQAGAPPANASGAPGYRNGLRAYWRASSSTRSSTSLSSISSFTEPNG